MQPHNVHDLRVLLGSSLFFISQCCPHAQFFLIGMLETLRSCPVSGEIPLSVEVQKDLNCFASYLLATNRIYIIHKHTRVPVTLHVNACSTRAGAIGGSEVYHTKFLVSIPKQDHAICHLEALNVVAAV